jgi:hypothetical protein
MAADKQIQSDMQYVRGVVESSQALPSMTPAVMYLWAVIVFVGFLMMDFDMSWFWLIGGIVGGLASFWLTRRAAETRGQVDQTTMQRANLHWAVALPVGLLLSIPLQMTGQIDEATNGQIALLIIAVVYFLAGVHIDRSMLWLGGFAVLAYASTFFVTVFVWTIPGALLAIGLALAGFQQQRA